MLMVSGALCFFFQINGWIESGLLTTCYIWHKEQVSFPSLYKSTNFLSQNLFRYEYCIRDHNVTFILNSIFIHNLILDASCFSEIIFSFLIGLISITSCVGLNILDSEPELVLLLNVFQVSFSKINVFTLMVVENFN